MDRVLKRLIESSEKTLFGKFCFWVFMWVGWLLYILSWLEFWLLVWMIYITFFIPFTAVMNSILFISWFILILMVD